MQPEDVDEKAKRQFLSQTQRWAIGVAVFLFGLGAWSYKKHGDTLYPRVHLPKGAQGLDAVGGASGLHAVGAASGLAKPERVELADLEAGPNSLEDALSTLESDGGWASQGIHLPESSHELPTAEKKPKKAKAAKAKPAASKPDAEEAPRPKAEPAPRRKEKVKAAAKGSDDIAAALEQLEAAPAGKKSSKKRKTSKADKEKAEDIIREALEKMQSAAPEQEEDESLLGGSALRERLEALVQDEEERDRDPDIRKAKSIIKDTIKKLDLPKAGKGKAAAAAKETEPEDEEGAAGDDSHIEFAKRLKEEAAIKGDHDMGTVREEFKGEFGSDSRRMLCSGCKLISARLDSELSAHDVHEAENPALMIASKRKAIDATCHSFRHVHVARGEGGPSFEATEVDSTDSAPRLAQKLCMALLEDAKFEVLSRLIRKKVPQASLFHTGESTSTNWERMLCAQRARVCKRNEVREDDDEEEL